MTGQADPGQGDPRAIFTAELRRVLDAAQGTAGDACLPGHTATVAATLTQVMEAQPAAAGRPGVTTDLQVTYRRPIPPRAGLTVRAGHRLLDDRRILLWAELEADGELTAEATATFVAALPLDGNVSWP
ncbi:hypothetical protein Aple_023740 [Acrocarpospora pleiomorpha]|uniref:Thioesterase domain-containing protein n=1 Tax=Acrocarpospora pleiomorpha TaxID=90975 RepID=A0A5M3XMR7_9ACTN|nr:hotdog fold domain-containing protein [Acrocarpospora pleiomorpha]GES19478.1 hypothetical protein Aple_023740 [Acrocarpospora pleiomorpha]